MFEGEKTQETHKTEKKKIQTGKKVEKTRKQEKREICFIRSQRIFVSGKKKHMKSTSKKEKKIEKKSQRRKNKKTQEISENICFI